MMPYGIYITFFLIVERSTSEALQKVVAAHKDGKRQEAESVSRTILRSQQGHPDANYHLGVIAVSVNKTDAASPFLRKVLEAIPKTE